MSVGKNIYRIRKEAGLTIRDISLMSKVALSLISQIENDKANPSLSTLLAISKALNVDISEIFDGSEKSSENPVVRKSDRVLCYDFKSWSKYLLINKNFEKFTISFDIIQPGADTDNSPEMNPKNSTGYEFCYVIYGKLHIKIEKQIYILNAGDSICFEAPKKHSVRNLSKRRTEIIWVMVPEWDESERATGK